MIRTVSSHYHKRKRDQGDADAISDELVEPVIVAAEAAILEAVATALERYASEYPDAPRAIRKEASA